MGLLTAYLPYLGELQQAIATHHEQIRSQTDGMAALVSI
jgi:hypothetical protein